jgi:hypothetical protein
MKMIWHQTIREYVNKVLQIFPKLVQKVRIIYIFEEQKFSVDPLIVNMIEVTFLHKFMKILPKSSSLPAEGRTSED